MANTQPTSDQIIHDPATGPAVTLKQYLDDLPSAAAGTSPLVSLTDFGAIGDGVTNNNAAFIAAEAHASPVIWVPPGIFVGTPASTLRKRYHGDGKLKIHGAFKGQEYVNINTPTPTLSSPAAYTEGDISKVTVETVTVDSPRKGIHEYYFESRVTPKFTQFFNNTGHSGSSAKITADVSIGVSQVQVNNVGTEITTGTQISIGDAAGQTTNLATVTSIAGNTIFFSPPTTHAALIANHQYVSVASRTMNPYQYVEMEHKGGGDAYLHVGRVVVSNQNQQPGQTHFFRTATGGMYGGDMYGAADGVYLTGTESFYIDTTSAGTKNIAAIDRVTNFQRDSDTGSYGCVWIGNLQQSYGSKPVDAAFSLLGKFKTGLNTVCADVDNGAAVVMKLGQKIIFDAVATSAQGDAILYGNVMGGTSIGTSGGGIEHKVNNVSVAIYSSSTWFFQSGVDVVFNKDVKMKQGFKLYFDANTGSPNTSLSDDGSFFKLTYDGVDKLLVDGSNIYLGNSGNTINLNQTVNFTGQTTTTSANTGFATALPAAPVFYMRIKHDGANYKIPVYND